ncbi:SCO family protein [Acidimangrovimonas sediminis]|uniref:SCO family protein n=1 Tax=Acidimangrovimonas sediminis TaxID=2056283 RepID=UPI000C80108F|nr:SCO family protein [Acidimangrovimonas sediminis]
MTRQNAVFSAFVVFVAVIVVGVGGYLYLRSQAGGDRFAACRGSAVAGKAAIGGPFTLTDGDGRTVSDEDVITKPSLVYFGYTFCPDVCPLDSARNADAIDLLDKRGLDAQAVFISIDPGRDTPAVVKEFAANFSPKMIGLTGTPEEVKAASRAYKTYYKVHSPPADAAPGTKAYADWQKYYLVDHSTFTYLVLPRAGFVDFFKREDTPQQIADRVACFVGAAKAN